MQHLRRGDRITMDGNTGTYIGRDTAGGLWVCWDADAETYAQMCRAFDWLHRRHTHTAARNAYVVSVKHTEQRKDNTMQHFRDDNTAGYTPEQRDALNAELALRLEGLEEGSDAYWEMVQQFQDEVARR